MSQPSTTEQTCTSTLGPALPGQHPDFEDADRHGHAIDAIGQFEHSALASLDMAEPETTAAAIKALAQQAREQLTWARKVVQARETQQVQLRQALAEAEETLENPAHCAPDLIGQADAERALALRVAERMRDTLNAVDGPKAANGK